MSQSSFDCVVVGAGPGGYVAAIRAAQLGLKTAVVEKETPGGVCLNWGCIPTKALLKSAEVYHVLQHASDYGIQASGVEANYDAIMKRSRKVVGRMTKGVQFLLKKNGIELIEGHAQFKPGNTLLVKDASGAEKTVSFKKAIIASGGRARTLPHMPVDEERILTYRFAVIQKELPKKLLVVGAGAIGMEFAYFFSSLGAEVTVVEMLDQVLPIEDAEVAGVVEKSFKKAGVDVRTSTVVETLERKGDEVHATLKSGDETTAWSGDYCLVAIGVQGNVENLGLEEVDIRAENSFIPVDEYYRTSSPDVYAIGDIIGPPLLAHVASHEGIIAAEHAAGLNPHVLDYRGIPGCTYCQPQVASIGMTEKAARETGRNIQVGKFPFTASGKAVAIGHTEGMVKVVIDEDLEEVLGVHIVHPEATELIGEASVIHSHEGIASSVFNTVHAHPTLSEAIMEAMGASLGKAIHI